jgi:hypothetical protein
MSAGLTDFALHRQIVDVLVADYEKEGPPSDPPRTRLMGCAWGLYAQVYRHARAAAVLTDASMEHEAHAHARGALEHAVMLHWVVERGDEGVEAVLANQEEQVSRSVRTARTANLELPAVAEEQIAADGPPVDVSKAYRTFRSVCEQVDVLDLYFIYGIESQFVHPSVMTINAYCDPSRGSGREILTTAPRPGDHHRHTFYLLACCLIWAGRDLRRLLPNPEKAARLAALAAQIEAATALPQFQPGDARSKDRKNNPPRNTGGPPGQ